MELYINIIFFIFYILWCFDFLRGLAGQGETAPPRANS